MASASVFSKEQSGAHKDILLAGLENSKDFLVWFDPDLPASADLNVKHKPDGSFLSIHSLYQLRFDLKDLLRPPRLFSGSLERESKKKVLSWFDDWGRLKRMNKGVLWNQGVILCPVGRVYPWA